jgi:K+-transporting ATPase ATPase C chain
MKSLVRPAFSLFVALSVITGLIYPLLITGIARMAFPYQASGSLIEHDGKILGSSLIGQPFSDPKHFWGRPSATSPNPYNALASSGSNLAPTNPALVDGVKTQIGALNAADPTLQGPIPADLVAASASGLDPQISPAAAYFQVDRIAKARNIPATRVKSIVDAHVVGRQLGFLGESTVNVLDLNLALDTLPP